MIPWPEAPGLLSNVLSTQKNISGVSRKEKSALFIFQWIVRGCHLMLGTHVKITRLVRSCVELAFANKKEAL